MKSFLTTINEHRNDYGLNSSVDFHIVILFPAGVSLSSRNLSGVGDSSKLLWPS